MVLLLAVALTVPPWIALGVSHLNRQLLHGTMIIAAAVDFVATIAFLYVCKSRTAGGWR